MVALHTRAQKQAINGPRPIKLQQDAPQIIDLLAMAFDLPLRRTTSYSRLVPELGYESIFQRLIGQPSPPVGFVWQENGRIVGNVSLIPTNNTGHYLIANVAVHPTFRRRGIAHQLMQTTIQWARQSRQNTLSLQVEEKNVGAVQLYEQLGFQTLASQTTWRNATGNMRGLSVPQTRRNPDEFDGFYLRPLRPAEWDEAYQLDTLVWPAALNVPDQLKPEAYKTTWRTWWHSFTHGYQFETWVVATPTEQIVGLGQIRTEWARPHTLKVRVHPDWQELVTRPLLAKLFRRVRYIGRRPVTLHHPTEDTFSSNLISEAGLETWQVLKLMRLDLKS